MSKNFTSRIYVLLLAKFSKVPGLGGGGGQPNFGNARILRPYGTPTPPLKGEERKGTRPSSRERVSVGADPSSPSPSLLGEPNIICKNNITFFSERGAHADMDLCGGTPLPRLHSLVIVGVYLQCCACIAYCTGNVGLCLTYNFFQDWHINLSFAKGLWEHWCCNPTAKKGPTSNKPCVWLNQFPITSRLLRAIQTNIECLKHWLLLGVVVSDGENWGQWKRRKQKGKQVWFWLLLFSS